MTTEQTKSFILAGRAIFTIANGKAAPDARDYTYKVTRKELDSWDGRNPTAKKPVYFVALLTGSDNETDYSYLGVLDPANGRVKVTAKSNFLPTSAPVVAVGWALGLLWAGKPFPGAATLQHAGRCGKCARLLTVPESIASGLGPECSGLGYTKPRNERKPGGIVDESPSLGSPLPTRRRTRKAPKPTFDELRAQAAASFIEAGDLLVTPAPTPAEVDADRATDLDLSDVDQDRAVEEILAEARRIFGRDVVVLDIPEVLDANGLDSVDRAERALGVE